MCRRSTLASAGMCASEQALWGGPDRDSAAFQSLAAIALRALDLSRSLLGIGPIALPRNFSAASTARAVVHTSGLLDRYERGQWLGVAARPAGQHAQLLLGAALAPHLCEASGPRLVTRTRYR